MPAESGPVTGDAQSSPGVTINVNSEDETNNQSQAVEIDISGLGTALNGLVDDIFALCVRYVIASHLPKHTKGVSESFLEGRRMKILWLVMSALFTFALQTTLVVLLWSAATDGNNPFFSETEELWQQVGYTHQLLCRANHSKLAQDIFTIPLKDCDCSAWWPSNPRFYPSYNQLRDCLSQSPHDMSLNASCRNVTLTINSTVRSYGRGFFTPGELDAPGNTSANIMPQKWDLELRIDPFFFQVSAFITLAIVVHTEFKQGVWLCYIAAGAVGVLPSFYSHRRVHGKPDTWQLAGHNALAHRMHWFHKLIVLLVPMLQLLGSLAVLATAGVMHLYQTSQPDAVAIIINSVALAFILEMDNKIGHILNLREDWRFPKITTFREAPPTPPSAPMPPQPEAPAEPGWFSQCCAKLFKEVRRALQHLQGYARRRQTGAGPAAGVAQAGGTARRDLCVNALGYLYMSIVGALMYAEVCFLAPQSAAQMISFVMVNFIIKQRPDGGAWYGGGTGLVPQFLANPSLSTADWFPDNLWKYWSLGGILDGYYGAQAKFVWYVPPRAPQGWITAAFIMYGLCTIVFVGLFCACMLPSSSKAWAIAVVCTQALLAVLVQLQDSTFKPYCNPEHPGFANLTSTTATREGGPDSTINQELRRQMCPRNFWWVVVVCVYACFWVVMFVVWPLQPKWWAAMQDAYHMYVDVYGRRRSAAAKVAHADRTPSASEASSSSSSGSTAAPPGAML